MQSLNLDFVFDKVYDMMLSIKYFWYFTLLNNSEDEYLERIKDAPWDGLRDREGWLTSSRSADDIIQNAKDALITSYNNQAESISAISLEDNIRNSYSLYDKLLSYIGITPRDSDNDGLPDSFEKLNGYDINNRDTDNDGLSDHDELKLDTDPVQADTDSDGVIDGRDYYPKDKDHSFAEGDADLDGDRVGDAVEEYIGGNSMTSDTDGDGIPDAYDVTIGGEGVNPFGITNMDNINLPVLSLEIKNHFLLFVGQLLGVLYIVAIPIFIYVMYNWYKQITHDVEHYEHLFHGAYGYDEIYPHTEHHEAGTSNDMLSELTEHKKNSSADENSNQLHHEAHFQANEELDNEKRDFREVWSKIELASNSGVEDERKMSLIQADNLLDDLLVKRGYMGSSMGDRLSSANFKTVDIAWDVHKLRNRLAHGNGESGLSDREARKAMLMYEVVFKDLNIL